MINYVQKKLIREERIKELLQISIDANQFTNNGPVKRKLECLLHEKFSLGDDKSVLCLSNGTSACHSLMFLYEKKLKKKLKWLIPSFTFPTPVVGGFSTKIVDINIDSYTIDLDEKLDEVDGVVITNLFGTCNQIEEWSKICKDKGKILIFDNASSPLTMLKNRSICDYGDASFGSLHHTKYLGFGEGGFVVVPKDDYDEINKISNFGFDSQRVHSKLSSNFKMSEIAAAYCYAQVESYDVKKHVDLQKKVFERLTQNGIEIFNVNNKQNKQSDYVLGNLPIIFKNPIDISSFRNLGIEANKYYKPLGRYKNSKDVFSRIINLPLNSGLTNYELEMIYKVILEMKTQNE